jgi:hypothetical protein
MSLESGRLENFSHSAAGIKHARFDGAFRHPNDVGNLLNGLLVIIDQIDNLSLRYR